MRSIKIFFLLFTFLFVTISCKKDKSDCKDEIEMCNNCLKDLEIINFKFNCEPVNDTQEYIINDDSTYQKLISMMPSVEMCDTIQLPYIDFSKKTLLGKYVTGSGCTICFHRKVLQDTVNQNYTYNIKIVELGKCEILRYSMNWITITKISPGYSVKFQLTRK